MRPPSIAKFERVVLVRLVIGFVITVLSWEVARIMAARMGAGTGLLIFSAALAIGITLLLLWLIAHRRSEVAKWIYVVLTTMGIVFGLVSISALLRQSTPIAILQIVHWGLGAFSIWLLFRPDTRPWFGKDASGAPASTPTP
jgi:hypothetical protein